MKSPFPKLIGILNITPDAFSDGGLYTAPDSAFKQAQRLLSQGASVIDIGAESTGPNAQPISHAEEWKRLEPILRRLQPLRKKIELSVDTRHFQTADNALLLGTDWINDVSGFANPLMIQAVKNSPCKLVIMHNLGVPANKNITISPTEDPIKTVYRWAEHKIKSLLDQGIKKDRLIFDPGIGFGKTAEQSLTLIQSASCFSMLGIPLYYGHSRKSFLSLISPKLAGNEQDQNTHTVSAYLYKQKIDYLRVHDIKGNLNALKQARKEIE